MFFLETKIPVHINVSQYNCQVITKSSPQSKYIFGFEKITSLTYRRITLAGTVQLLLWSIGWKFGPYYLQLQFT